MNFVRPVVLQNLPTWRKCEEYKMSVINTFMPMAGWMWMSSDDNTEMRKRDPPRVMETKFAITNQLSISDDNVYDCAHGLQRDLLVWHCYVNPFKSIAWYRSFVALVSL
jgi:hypothetical protein